MMTIEFILDEITRKIERRRQFKDDYFKATGKVNQEIEQETIKLERLFEKVQSYIASYKELIRISDSQLCIRNSNSRINFEDDLVYKQAGPLLREKFLSRTITAEEYWGFVFSELSPLKDIRIRCANCRKRTSYNYSKDDGILRICVYCGHNLSIRGIPHDYDEDMNDLLNYLQDHNDQ
jgi:predicted DNA-binding transcriptional regulator